MQRYVFGGNRPPSELLFPRYRTGKEAPLTTVRSILGRVVVHAIEKLGGCTSWTKGARGRQT